MKPLAILLFHPLRAAIADCGQSGCDPGVRLFTIQA
jgi:hypothetical protein